MKRLIPLGALVLSAMLPVTVFAAASLVVNRGLPTANLNNAAGASRSNVAWSFGNDYITGDDFTIGSAGQSWVITKIRTWSINGTPETAEMGDRFSSVSLYGGTASAYLPLTPISTGTLSTGSSANSNPNITHTRVTYAGGADYQGSSGAYIQIWQNDFSNLAWVVDGGTLYVVGVDGTLRPSASYYWFNHASNAALSGSTQDGSDDLFWYWAKDGTDSGQWDSNGGGWDKSSDINVQVWASHIATDKNNCKNYGWQALVRADGSGFKNQGDCIQYVNTGK